MALGVWQATIVDDAGNVQESAQIEVRRESSGALAAIYADRDGTTPLTNPFAADSDGFARFYVAGGAFKIAATKGGFERTWRHQAIGLLSEFDSVPGTLIEYPRTAAEIASSVTPSDTSKPPYYYDVRRAGIVPNDAGAATANTTALKALLDPTVTGITGTVIFPNTTGADTYHFNNIVQIRDGVHLDLNGCTLDFTKASYESADDTMGFLMMIRDVIVENGSINFDYDGTGGSNAGLPIRIGSRQGYAFGSYTDGIFDKDDLADNGLPPMGNVTLRNLRLSSNNGGVAAVVSIIGGLRNLLFENLVIDGNGQHTNAFYGEFGFASTNGSSDKKDWSTSHPSNIVFRNIQASNLKADAGLGSAIGYRGAYNCRIENLQVDGARSAVEISTGEAMNYRPWAADAAGVKRCITLRNIVGQNLTGVGITLAGATSPSGGYLAGAGLTEAQQVDLYDFSVDGFALSAGAGGITISGPSDIRNGTITGTCTSGGIIVTDEAVRFNIDCVRILGGNSVAIRANFGGGLWSVPRLKIGTIRNCQIAGNGNAAIALGNARSVLIENCRLGYNTAYDATSESTQTGIIVASTASGVVCRGNFVSVASGNAYILQGTGPRRCNIENPSGTVTTSGIWNFDGVAVATATAIADASHNVNTEGKHVGRLAYETSNTRLLVATGSGPTSNWVVADGSATVTPA